MTSVSITSERPMLIGYDGSAEAAYAIGVAAAVLVPTRAVVVNVAPLLTVGQSLVSVGSPVAGHAAYEDLNRTDGLRRAEAGAAVARAAGLHADARVCVAAPTWEGVVQAADDVDAAVIVLGSRERRGAAKLLDRGIARDVAHQAGRPVLLVPRSAQGRVGVGPVLLGWDGSENARKAMETAHALIRARQAVVLEAVGADAGVDVARTLGFDVDARPVPGPTTGRALMDVADERDSSVIVVASDPNASPGVLEHTFSEDVAEHAHRPVLVVPPAPGGDARDVPS